MPLRSSDLPRQSRGACSGPLSKKEAISLQALWHAAIGLTEHHVRFEPGMFVVTHGGQADALAQDLEELLLCPSVCLGRNELFYDEAEAAWDLVQRLKF